MSLTIPISVAPCFYCKREFTVLYQTNKCPWCKRVNDWAQTYRMQTGRWPHRTRGAHA